MYLSRCPDCHTTSLSLATKSKVNVSLQSTLVCCQWCVWRTVNGAFDFNPMIAFDFFIMVLAYCHLTNTCTQLLDSKYFNRYCPDNFQKFHRIVVDQLFYCHSQGSQGMTGPAGKTGAQGASVSKTVNYQLLDEVEQSIVFYQRQRDQLSKLKAGTKQLTVERSELPHSHSRLGTQKAISSIYSRQTKPQKTDISACQIICHPYLFRI